MTPVDQKLALTLLRDLLSGEGLVETVQCNVNTTAALRKSVTVTVIPIEVCYDCLSATVCRGVSESLAINSCCTILSANALTFAASVSSRNFSIPRWNTCWPMPTGALSHFVTRIPTPGIMCFLRYFTHMFTISGSASHALMARLCTRRSKFS